MSTAVEELEKRRADRKAAHDAARTAQYAKDLEALDALEVQYGDGAVASLPLPFFAPGLPTFVVVKVPEATYFGRFRDMVRKAKGANGPALDMLADNCVVYPNAETYTKLREKFPGVHDSVGMKAVELAQAKTVEEGKG